MGILGGALSGFTKDLTKDQMKLLKKSLISNVAGTIGGGIIGGIASEDDDKLSGIIGGASLGSALGGGIGKQILKKDPGINKQLYKNAKYEMPDLQEFEDQFKRMKQHVIDNQDTNKIYKNIIKATETDWGKSIIKGSNYGKMDRASFAKQYGGKAEKYATHMKVAEYISLGSGLTGMAIGAANTEEGESVFGNALSGFGKGTMIGGVAGFGIRTGVARSLIKGEGKGLAKAGGNLDDLDDAFNFN